MDSRESVNLTCWTVNGLVESVSLARRTVNELAESVSLAGRTVNGLDASDVKVGIRGLRCIQLTVALCDGPLPRGPVDGQRGPAVTVLARDVDQ